MRHDGEMMFSKPSVSTLSRSFKERSAFFSRWINAFLFLTDGPGSGDKERVGELPSVGELHGVTVGEKFWPEGVFKALGVTALMPLSFRTEASPMLTENVLHELRRERFRGVGGALNWFNNECHWKISTNGEQNTYVGCLEVAVDCIRDDICDGGKLNVMLEVPSSDGWRTVLFVNV